MHARRKGERPQIYAPDGSHLEVDAVYWQQVAERDRADLTHFAFFEPVDSDVLQFRFLNEAVRIDLSRRCLLRKQASQWEKSDDPLLTLVAVMYLKNINAIYPMGKDIVGVNDLKEGHFFAGPHEFRLQPLLKRFANDPAGFRAAAMALDGHPVDMADAGFRLLPFPRVPLYFLLWLGDDEFKPRIQVLFDRPIASLLAADAIWALVNRVAMAMTQG